MSIFTLLKMHSGSVLAEWHWSVNWVPLSSEFESITSFLQLALLAVVWTTEEFENYVYVIKILFASDHKALKAALKSKNENSFEHVIDYMVRKTSIWLWNCVWVQRNTWFSWTNLSGPCSDLEDIIDAAESLWHERWFTVNVVSDFDSFFKSKHHHSKERALRTEIKCRKHNLTMNTKWNYSKNATSLRKLMIKVRSWLSIKSDRKDESNVDKITRKYEMSTYFAKKIYPHPFQVRKE